jgi:hypothetical protein
MGWIMGWIMRWIMRNDQWKKTMNIKKWQGNTLIDVTGYAFCHCHAQGINWFTAGRPDPTGS